MSLAELKLEAQQLGLTKEKVAEFGDLRKKVTWELAIADFRAQSLKDEINALHEAEVKIWKSKTEPKLLFESASMLESANEGTGVSEIFMDGKSNFSCMDAEKVIADKLVNIPISFGKTLEQLLSGRKTVTRRPWKDDYANQFVKRFSEGRTIYPAFDKDRRYGGKQVGTVRLTCSPYKERLGDMPESDLAKEGFPELTRQEFISRFFGGDSDTEVWVIRFEFILDATVLFQPQTEEEVTVSDNLFEPLAEPEIINITRETHTEIWQHLEPPTEPEIAIGQREQETVTEPEINWIPATSDDCCCDYRLADYKGWKISTYSPNGGIVAASIHKNGVYWQVSTDHLEAWFDAEFHIELAKKFIDSLSPEQETVSVTYQVVTDPTPIPPACFSRPEQKHTLPKLPGQDFFVWLFSPPKVSVINQ